jgi:hypothetical protein
MSNLLFDLYAFIALQSIKPTSSAQPTGIFILWNEELPDS